MRGGSPPEAGNDADIDPRWLVTNSEQWLYGGARIEDVFLRPSTSY